MNEVTRISGVRGFVDGNGVAQLNAEDIARGWGFVQTARSGNIVVRWERVNAYLKEFGFVPTSGDGITKDDFIPENMAYRLGFKASNEAAQVFQAKLADEILPAIRKHGGYLTPEKVEEVLLNPDTIITLATNLKAEQEKRKAAELQIEADRPKVVFADSVSVSHTNILISELAKVLKQNGVPNMGQNRLFQWMRDNNYLISRRGTDYNMPMQKSMEMGLFCIKETTVNHSDGHTSISRTPKVTGKGQIYFVNKFLNSTKSLADDGVAK